MLNYSTNDIATTGEHGVVLYLSALTNTFKI